jgi:N utilization substance protein A
MNAEFFSAIADIEKEKGISQAYMIERIEQAMLAALKKDMPEEADSARVTLDPEKKTIEVCIQKTVVDAVTDPHTQMTPEQAGRFREGAQVGDVINCPVETGKFGRIAAQAAKQVIIQGIREAERNLVYEEFASKEREILTGIVSRVDPRSGVVTVQINSNAEMTEAILPAAEQIPGECIVDGDRLKVFVMEVKKTARGPRILISRTHPGLVKRVFELEVPEIYDGTVEIRSIAREPGNRTKIAVASNDPDVEPIGACVGPRGDRVNAVVRELDGEKIDIVRYSDDPEEYISAALAPSDVVNVTVLGDGKSCRVVVPDNQLSLAIGKEGQNVRLAARLTGFKIDIRPQSHPMPDPPVDSPADYTDESSGETDTGGDTETGEEPAPASGSDAAEVAKTPETPASAAG